MRIAKIINIRDEQMAEVTRYIVKEILGINKNLAGMDLSGLDLAGIDFQGANLRGANLMGVNLANANLQNANLQNVNLTCANLTCANLDGANLNNTTLRYARLLNTHFGDPTWLSGESHADKLAIYARSA